MMKKTFPQAQILFDRIRTQKETETIHKTLQLFEAQMQHTAHNPAAENTHPTHI